MTTPILAHENTIEEWINGSKIRDSIKYNTYNDVGLSWKKSKGATGYYIYSKKVNAKSYKYLGKTTKTFFTKKDLSDGQKYTFKVLPYYKKNGKNTKGYAASFVDVYTLKKVSLPQISKYSDKKIEIRWTNIEGESGYQISRSTKKKGTNIIGTYTSEKLKSNVLKVAKEKNIITR